MNKLTFLAEYEKEEILTISNDTKLEEPFSFMAAPSVYAHMHIFA